METQPPDYPYCAIAFGLGHQYAHGFSSWGRGRRSLSAFMLISRMNSGQNNAGFGFELQVIGAVLLGGASLFGGKGTLFGMLFAAVLLGTLNNGITLLQWNTNWQTAVPGIVILLAVFLDAMRRRATREE